MKTELKIIVFKYLTTFCLLSIITIFCISCSSRSDSNDSGVKPDVVVPTDNTSTFKNPVLGAGPDPWVIKNGEEYFVTYTTGNNITLVRTSKMSDLKNGVQKIIWTPPSTGMNSKEIWAPELHKINDIWYLYYAASNGDNSTHRMWVLQNVSKDPFQGVWVDKGELKLPDNKWAIDGTPFELNGKLYFAWSGWEGDSNVKQELYIAEMENPTSIIGQRISLLKPTYPWETNGTNPQVVEGPQFLIKNDKVFIFYSAGGCWKDGYSIGAIYMDINSNPKDLNSWKRVSNSPLFESNNTGNAFGPGHNSFFKSLDGKEDWILYHANPQPGQGCGGNRSVRMQKFSWDNNGLPILGVPEPLNKDILKPSGE